MQRRCSGDISKEFLYCCRVRLQRTGIIAWRDDKDEVRTSSCCFFCKFNGLAGATSTYTSNYGRFGESDVVESKAQSLN